MNQTDGDAARRSPFALAVMTLSVLVVGCDAGDGGADPRAVPDGTPVSIGEDARLSVGVVEGDTIEQFHDVVTPFLLPDGELVVPVAGASAIRVFAPDGRFLRSFGRPGEGPGEFTGLDAAWSRGDTIEAFDSDLRRITRFPPGGAPDVVPLDRVGSVQTAIPGALLDGWVFTGVADAGMGRRDEMPVYRFARDGSHTGVVARARGMARFSTPAISGPDPLSPRAVFAVRRGEIYVAETLTPRIRVLDGTGSLAREITWEPDGAPSPEAAFERVVEAGVARAAPDDAEATRSRLESFEVRERAPAFWDFIVDEEGFIWVQPFDPGRHSLALTGFRGTGSGGEWRILSADGTRVGSVRVPDRLELTEVTSEAVVGIRRDELGVESVEVHALERR